MTPEQIRQLLKDTGCTPDEIEEYLDEDFKRRTRDETEHEREEVKNELA